MTMEQLFFDYYDAFEEAYRTDEWSELERYFAEGATYAVTGTGFPWPAELHGPSAIVGGMRKSTNGFDRHFAERWLGVLGRPVATAKGVSCELLGVWSRPGTPPLVLPVATHVEFQGGKISRLTDVYGEERLQGAMTWLSEHGEGLDPSYA